MTRVPPPSLDLLAECPRCGLCFDPGPVACPACGSPPDPGPASRLVGGRYRLERRIIQGGMGTIYEAADTRDGGRVAVKVVRREISGSPGIEEMFRREMRLAASFPHPRVVRVLEAGVEETGRAFLVMELLRGCTLREAIDRAGSLDPTRLATILPAVCEAVEAAHRRGLIHRDLKPENVFLAGEPSAPDVKVLDFGVARVLPAPTVPLPHGPGREALLGSPLYMAPELLRGEPPAASGDLWSLAVVAFESLTGKHPFPGTDVTSRREAILAGRRLSSAEALPGSPAGWEGFFSRALHPDPARRFAGVAEFRAGLLRALQDRPDAGKPGRAEP